MSVVIGQLKPDTFLLDQNVLINSFHSHNKSKLSVLVILFILSRAVPGFFSRGGVQLLPGWVQNYRNTIPFHIQADVSRFYLF